MTPTEQIEFFARVQAKFPAADPRFCSGYVHGVVDEARLPGPGLHYVGGLGPYAGGYCAGFADARGPDAFDIPGLSKIDVIDFEWWKKEDG